MNRNTKALLLNIKNSSAIKKCGFYANLSKRNIKILQILYTQGFIQSYTIFQSSKQLYVFIRYYNNKPIFKTLKLISTKSSKRTNLNFLELAKFFNKRLVLFLSTNKGLCTSLFCLKSKTGGKALFLC